MLIAVNYISDDLITAQAVTGLNPVEVTLAENWLKLTGSPLFIFAKSTDNKGIEEKMEFTLLV